jgi:hypothetical protein
MTFQSELVARVRSYLDGTTSFVELAGWVDAHDGEWDTVDLDAWPTQLGNAIILTLYEHQHGDHTEQSLHDRIASEFAEIVGSRAST